MPKSQPQSKPLASAVSLTAARQNLFELVEGVATTGQPVTLTEHGQPKVALIAIDDFEAWLETRSCLPLRSGHQAIKEPNITSRYERLANSLEQAGFMLYEKPTTAYTVRVKTKIKPKRRRSI